MFLLFKHLGVFLYIPYAWESHGKVDKNHNPSQSLQGLVVINVKSLGGSSPSGLCLAGCS